MFGHAYRKYASQLWAFVAFKWIGIWVLIAACCSNGKIGEVAAFVIMAVDISAGMIAKMIVGSVEEKYRKDWHDRLTNRLFYKLFWDQLASGGARSIDVDDLMRVATKEAVADVKKQSDGDRVSFGKFDTTAWHWFGGLLSFLSQVIGSTLYYVTAWTVGHAS